MLVDWAPCVLWTSLPLTSETLQSLLSGTEVNVEDKQDVGHESQSIHNLALLLRTRKLYR